MAGALASAVGAVGAALGGWWVHRRLRELSYEDYSEYSDEYEDSPADAQEAPLEDHEDGDWPPSDAHEEHTYEAEEPVRAEANERQRELEALRQLNERQREALLQAHERQRESAEAEGARAEALQERLTQALLEIATVRQTHDALSIELRETRSVKERVEQEAERLRSSPLPSPRRLEETAPSVDAAMACFIDSDGFAEAAPLEAPPSSPVGRTISKIDTLYQPTHVTPGAPLAPTQAPPSSPVGRTISKIDTLYQPTHVTPGVDVERDAMLVVERALTSLHTRAEAPAAAASSAAPRNDFPVANLFGASPTAPKAQATPVARQLSHDKATAPPPAAQQLPPPQLPPLPLQGALSFPLPAEQSPRLSAAWQTMVMPRVTSDSALSTGSNSAAHSTQSAAAMFSQGNPFASRSSFETGRETMLFPPPMAGGGMMQQPMPMPMQPPQSQRRQRRLTCASQDSEMTKTNFSAAPSAQQQQMMPPHQESSTTAARRAKRLSSTMALAPLQGGDTR